VAQQFPIILVTGANRGIGLEICKQLLAKNCEVIASGRDLEKLQKAFAAEQKNQVHFLEMDVSSPESILHAPEIAGKQFSHLDVLINNAGIISNRTSLTNMKWEDFEKVQATNFYGPLQVIRAFLPMLRKKKGSRIINISSGMGAWDDLVGNYAAYRMSKHSMNAMTQMLAHELQNENISVNAVCPGWVRTEMGGSGASRSVEKGAETPVWLALEKNIPTGKFFRDKKVIEW